jgi:hypothetical protein
MQCTAALSHTFFFNINKYSCEMKCTVGSSSFPFKCLLDMNQKGQESFVSVSEVITSYESIDRPSSSSTRQEKFQEIEKRLLRKLDLR